MEGRSHPTQGLPESFSGCRVAFTRSGHLSVSWWNTYLLHLSRSILCKLSKWPQTYKWGGRGRGSSESYGRNPEQKLNAEKSPGDLGLDRFPILQEQAQVMKKVPDLWGPPGAACPLNMAPRSGPKEAGHLTSGWVEQPLPGARFPAGSPARWR